MRLDTRAHSDGNGGTYIKWGIIARATAGVLCTLTLTMMAYALSEIREVSDRLIRVEGKMDQADEVRRDMAKVLVELSKKTTFFRSDEDKEWQSMKERVMRLEMEHRNGWRK